MPACRVVTIARSNGAQAETIGHAVAEQLGFHFVDDEIILQAAEKAGVSPQTIGQEEHSPSRLARIMKAMATVATSDPGAYVAAIDLSDPSPAYRHLIQDVIQETAASGKVVIAAHAAGISLAGEPGVLRVFITASPDVRAKRIAAEEKLDQVQAKKQVEHSDRERQAYLQRFYAIRQEQPTHYDLVVNTDLLTPAAATALIAAAARAME